MRSIYQTLLLPLLISLANRVLLDDCLAPVDSHVARHVFGLSIRCLAPVFYSLNPNVENVIGPNGILSTKARILVTNSIAYINQFDQLLFVRRGVILESGSYESLMANPESELHKLVYVDHWHGLFHH